MDERTIWVDHVHQAPEQLRDTDWLNDQIDRRIGVWISGGLLLLVVGVVLALATWAWWMGAQ